jgi:hypothetical protein
VKAILISHYKVGHVGHGGYHRSYQILHELGQTLDQDNVIRFDEPWQYWFSTSKLLRFVYQVRKGLTMWAENPYKILARTPFSRKLFSFPRLLAEYERLIKSVQTPAVCVVEHPGFADLLPINKHYGIPTIICPQNVESLDAGMKFHSSKWGIYAKSIDFANEFAVFEECNERLFISKVETALVSALGLTSHYYPYRPVGRIRERHLQIRQARAQGGVESGMFLLLGTAKHETTWESFAWFVQTVQAHGLPGGVKVVVVGSGTDKLLPAANSVPGLELRGWLEQDELDRLLVRANAVLIPQRSGFGALTRLPELACAGVPAIVSRHASYALNTPPGLEILDDNCWDTWYTKIEQFARQKAQLPDNDYYAWEEEQPKTLEVVLKKFR